MHDEDHDAEENTLENEDSDDYYGWGWLVEI